MAQTDFLWKLGETKKHIYFDCGSKASSCYSLYSKKLIVSFIVMKLCVTSEA